MSHIILHIPPRPAPCKNRARSRTGCRKRAGIDIALARTVPTGKKTDRCDLPGAGSGGGNPEKAPRMGTCWAESSILPARSLFFRVCDCREKTCLSAWKEELSAQQILAVKRRAICRSRRRPSHGAHPTPSRASLSSLPRIERTIT